MLSGSQYDSSECPFDFKSNDSLEENNTPLENLTMGHIDLKIASPY
jgi:hypothetical protein